MALLESDRAPSVGEGCSMCWLLVSCFAMPACLRRGDLAGVNQPGRRFAPSLESNDASAVPLRCGGVGRCAETHARVPTRERHSVWDSSAHSLPARTPGGELRVATRSRCIFRTGVVIRYLWRFACPFSKRFREGRPTDLSHAGTPMVQTEADGSSGVSQCRRESDLVRYG